MKILRENLLSILLLAAVLGIGVLVPSLIIQSIWNSFYLGMIERDLTIELWQASLLWGAGLTLLHITGIFRVQLSLKNLNSINLDEIDDPELKEELRKLKLFEESLEEKKKEDEKKES